MYSPPLAHLIYLLKRGTLIPLLFFGGANQTRTDDPLLAKQVLYQLSYDPKTLHFQFESEQILSILKINVNRKILFIVDKYFLYNIILFTMATRIQIPDDFQTRLPELKEKSFKWRLEYSSRTALSTIAHITHYSPILPDGKKANGNIILAPGLASNADIEPLMQSITYWALTKRFNIYAITTFLGDFKEEITHELAAQNTFSEFITLMDMGIDLIEQQCHDQWTCMIGHSVGATGAIEIFNKRVQANKKPRLSAAILFAPYTIPQWHDYIKSVYKSRNCAPDITDQEFEKTPIGIISPHDIWHSKKKRHITIYPKFYDDVDDVEIRPDLMSQYNIPITIVGGGKDRKSPIELLRKIYDALQLQSNAHLFKFVEFPNSKHSFVDQHRDYNAIINLIKSQHIRKKRSK